MLSASISHSGKGVKSFFDTFSASVFYINNEGVEPPFDVCFTNFGSRLARRSSGGFTRRPFGGFIRRTSGGLVRRPSGGFIRRFCGGLF